MNTHKEPKDKYIEAREKVLEILIDEYKQDCNFDALMRIMAIVEEYGGTVEPELLSNCCGAKPMAITLAGHGRCSDCKENCSFDEEVEPTPPSQIEEESQTQRSLREMYELGKEHGRTLALKDMEIEKLIKEIKGE